MGVQKNILVGGGGGVSLLLGVVTLLGTVTEGAPAVPPFSSSSYSFTPESSVFWVEGNRVLSGTKKDTLINVLGKKIPYYANSIFRHDCSETRSIQWPETSPLGLNLIFCSCASHEHQHRTHETTEPDDLLWDGSRKTTTIILPKKWWSDVVWTSLWRDNDQKCGCGQAFVSSFTSTQKEVQGEWLAAHTNGKTSEGDTNSAYLFISLQRTTLKPIITDVTEDNMMMGRMSGTPMNPKDMTYFVNDFSDDIGSTPQCLVSNSDILNKREEWVAVWGVADSKDLLTKHQLGEREYGSEGRRRNPGVEEEEEERVEEEEEVEVALPYIKKSGKLIGPRRRPLTTTTTTTTTTNPIVREVVEDFDYESFNEPEIFGSNSKLPFIRFLDQKNWRLGIMSRVSSSIANFKIEQESSKALFCLAVWVGDEHTPKFRLSVWKNWKPFTSAPIIVQNVGYSSDVFWHETLRSKIVDRSRDLIETKVTKKIGEDWANKKQTVVAMFISGIVCITVTVISIFSIVIYYKIKMPKF
uniref:WSSV122 n=1 Tax=White spot syndrome virus TaxID=342409 RepID=A0A3G5BHV8_9VIRU|nr:WSSV122 [White spot syndrome virus]